MASGADAGVLPAVDALKRVAALSPAQRTMLTSLGAAGEPVTAATLAEELGIRPSTARETLDGLLASGLVRRERMPITGPGRPSYGYVATTPTGVDGPMSMFVDIVTATAETLREVHSDPAAVAQAIGRSWAGRMVGRTLPDHAEHDDEAYGHLALAGHMDKIAYFFTALGFGATVSDSRREVRLRSCPFVEAGGVDPLVCEMHRGMTREVIALTSRGQVEAELRPWVTPERCEVSVAEIDTDAEKPEAS
ncbi:helix-turn-helix transcriptional regulator [Mobilicoccus pelagius]|uniref:helix-turn-helix transcriptional regulator n=1 Tax=Mobilicoccus pelagius TaxID=746032 RepID=UPI00058AF947|nr:helix-turn-helix domain-containing protein [Mobilicoccus pelagius]